MHRDVRYCASACAAVRNCTELAYAVRCAVLSERMVPDVIGEGTGELALSQVRTVCSYAYQHTTLSTVLCASA
eukprot:288117-Rhodomonas_salina.2